MQNSMVYIKIKKTMIRKIFFVIVFCFYSLCTFAQSLTSLNLTREIPKDSIYYVQAKTDSLFNSKQIISLMALQKKSIDKFQLEFGYRKKDLKQTSLIAKDYNAYAAINAGFFDMDKGGSVSYFEVNDTVISYTHPTEQKWAKPITIINGAIIFTKRDEIVIQLRETDQFYEQSKTERAVLVTGPVLLLDSKKNDLQGTNFAKTRHPRTYFCTTDNYVVLITIDGRSEQAAGMSLYEAQDFLLSIGCTYAINLDGGGSTTMWIKGKGIVNYPSDKTGERPVSNAILLLNNN